MNIKPLLEDADSILVIGHQNADPDAVASVIAFSELYRTVNPAGASVLACTDISRLSQQVLDTFAPDIKIVKEPDLEPALVVLVDTNSREQVGGKLKNYLNNPSQTLVIDHHEPNPEIEELASHVIQEPDCSSTCELLLSIFNDMGLQPSKTAANLLLTGLLFDTRRFFYTDKKTLLAATDLIEAGADYESCVTSLIIRPERSERIARLKAAQRTKIHKIDEWIVVTSVIGAFEASSCRGLISLGADVAIAGGQQGEDSVRLSSRSTKDFYNETGINLGSDVMEPVGEIIGGKGGGHPNAAGANGKGNLKKALNKSVELIKKAIHAR
ncbi:MAG: hypothetical protein GF309_02510 [Candidatus Lokiarchaeota archaeon]|nr:hypothetical protein [Candidatus Lokiarchaeota archaeon]